VETVQLSSKLNV